ncbi:MAG: leucine--tRNA ligase [Thermofilum sp.]
MLQVTLIATSRQRLFPPLDEEKRNFLVEIERKWQRIWQEKKVFEADPDPSRPKYFVTFPYPYINAYPHLGTAYTVLRVDILARYKRMRGYNVLFPQGWHATGGPIVAAALRVREGDRKQIEILKSMGIPESEIKKFEKPEYWVEFFRGGFKEDFQRYGLSIDWRREFFTTYLNPPYTKFIQWQYSRLRKLGLVTRGTHPVVWCPKEGKVVGDHDRPDEYAGIGPEEVIIIKFRGEDGYVYPCLTYRPETVYGAVNVWVNPEATYTVAEVDGEVWILGNYAIEELRSQGHRVEVRGAVKGRELVGHFAVNPVTKWRVPVLPAEFVDPEAGTGVVMSVPAHAPFDYVAIEDLRKDPNILARYDLDPGILEILKPISLIELEGYGEVPAETVVRRMRIASQLERDKLEEATRELYAKEYYTGTLKKDIYGERWGGRKVFEVKEEIVDFLVKLGYALTHFTLPRPVYCRCGTRTHVKVVHDQWFLRYSDPAWKQRAHSCVERMSIIPEELKKEFHKIIDWYKDWACAHEGELGSPLPWDPKWTLESLSDSTIYMAYYTISKYLQHPEKWGIDWDKLNESFFDYIFLGSGDPREVSAKVGVDPALLQRMREEFLYWYPVDMRVSGKDLMPNHLVFFILHHVAIFPEELWPRGICINGWINVAGEKMAKSKGNFILLREALSWWGADATRFAEAYAGNSGLDDGNFEPEVASKAVELLYDWYKFATSNYGSGDDTERFIDRWFTSVLFRTLEKVEKEYEFLNTKNVIVEGFFNLQNAYKWYIRRRGGVANRELLKKFIEIQTLILAPITPHIAEEIWERLGKPNFASLEKWPEVRRDLVNEELERAEEIVKKVAADLEEVLRVSKKSRESVTVTLVLPSRWKYDYLKSVANAAAASGNLPSAAREALRALPPELRSKASRLIEIIAKNPGLLDFLVSPELEGEALKDAEKFLEETLGCSIEIVHEDEVADKYPKAALALPARPAIIVS